MATVEVKCYIAFASDPMDETPTWADVSDDLMEVHIRRGRQHELNRIETGTATVVLKNTSGNYWPNNTDGDYYPFVKPLKRIKITATYDSTEYDEYVGFIESWDPGYLSEPKGPVMMLNCADLQKNLSRIEAESESEELSGTRVGNILDTLGWPAGDRDLAAGQSTIVAGPAAGTNALDHLYAVQESEVGIFFIARNGDATFHDRDTRGDSPYDTSQATFGDGAGEMRIRTVKFSLEDQYIYNKIQGQRDGGSQQTSQDSDSQTKYGVRVLTKSGLLLTSDPLVNTLCTYILAKYKDPSFRVRSLGIIPDLDPANLYPKVLSYDISTRISVHMAEAGINEEYHIEGISHDWTMGNGWTTTWQLSATTNLEYPEQEENELLVTGDGDTVALYPVPIDNPTHYDCVQVLSDSKYILGGYHTYDYDLYTLEDVADIGLTLKVKVEGYLSNPNTYDCTGYFMLKYKGSVYTSPAITIPGSSSGTPYGYFSYEWDLSADPLTISEVNAMQAGWKHYNPYLGLALDYLHVTITNYKA